MKNIKAATPAGIPARSIEMITSEIQFYKTNASTCLLEIGKRLLEAKAQLSHGDWLPWLKEKVAFSDRTAQNLMRIAKEYTNPQLVADLGTSKAILLMALESGEREEFASAPHVLASGEAKMVKDMSSDELKAALQELEAVRTAAQRSEEQMTLRLEEAEREHEEELSAVQNELAVRSEEYEERLRKKTEHTAKQLAKQEELIIELERKLDKARREASEPDENMLAKLRSQMAAEEAKKVERKLAKAKEEVDILAFKIRFETAQKEINTLINYLDEMAAGGKAELKEKMSRAMIFFLECTLLEIKGDTKSLEAGARGGQT